MTKSSIVLGGGCFWCIEAVFQRVRGIESVVSGYAGGDLKNPTYHNHGNHAEVVKIEFDESLIDLSTILDIFWTTHNPTTINQQGNDVGTQYRSIILYNNEQQKDVIMQSIESTAKQLWDDPIVTEVKKLDMFYPAEKYHQNYYNQNQSNPYCQVVIDPKLAKFRSKFSKYINDND